jgi:hypothetical protein
MSKKQHIIYFIGLLIICLVLVLILKAPERNLIPVLWIVLAFVRYGFLLMKSAHELMDILITDHEVVLKELKIEYQVFKYKDTMSFSDISKHRQKIEALTPEIKSLYQKYLIFIRLSVSAFLLTIALCLLLFI